MSFIINYSGDLIYSNNDTLELALSCIDKKFIISSLGNKQETDTFIYDNLEQALDDFEFYTSSIPKKTIQLYKSSLHKIQNSNNPDFVFETFEDYNSLIHTPTGYQLNVIPLDLSPSKENEFSITTIDFEPIEDYEVLSKTFTTDFSEALTEFENLVGSVPEKIVSSFLQDSF